MLQQQKVTIKPTPGGALFINEMGEATPYIGVRSWWKSAAFWRW